MPSVSVASCVHNAVVWPFLDVNQDNEPLFSAPEDIKVRWEKKRLQRIADDGNIGVTVASVLVSREVVVGSLMREGKLEDLPESPTEVPSNLFEVMDYDEVPNVKHRDPARSVRLQRWKGAVPVVQ